MRSANGTKCRFCGGTNAPNALNCAFCGHDLTAQAAGAAPQPGAAQLYACPTCAAPIGPYDRACGRCGTRRPLAPMHAVPHNAAASNNSGSGGVAPDEIARGWNWGAFLLTPVWCLGMGMPIWALVSFLVHLPVGIYLGIKGNELAWQNRRFASVDHFRQVQKAWTLWGLVAHAILAVLVGVVVVLMVYGYMRYSGAVGNLTSPD